MFCSWLTTSECLRTNIDAHGIIQAHVLGSYAAWDKCLSMTHHNDISKLLVQSRMTLSDSGTLRTEIWSLYDERLARGRSGGAEIGIPHVSTHEDDVIHLTLLWRNKDYQTQRPTLRPDQILGHLFIYTFFPQALDSWVQTHPAVNTIAWRTHGRYIESDSITEMQREAAAKYCDEDDRHSLYVYIHIWTKGTNWIEIEVAIALN